MLADERRRLGAEAFLERARRCRARTRAGRRAAGARRQRGAAAIRGRGRRGSRRLRRRAPPARPRAAAIALPLHVRLEPRDHRLHRHRLALRDENLGEHAARRRRNLGVDLVRRDLEHRLVALHLVADLLQPLRQRAFGDRLAHLGHDDVYACHRITLVPSCSRACAPAAAARSPSTASSTALRSIAPKTTYVTSCTARRSPPPTDALSSTRPRSSQSAPRSFRRRRSRRTR